MILDYASKNSGLSHSLAADEHMVLEAKSCLQLRVLQLLLSERVAKQYVAAACFCRHLNRQSHTGAQNDRKAPVLSQLRAGRVTKVAHNSKFREAYLVNFCLGILWGARCNVDRISM